MHSPGDSSGRTLSGEQADTDADGSYGWKTEEELVKTFDRPVNVQDAVGMTVIEAVKEWPELSDTPPLTEFVDVEYLDDLFRTAGADARRRLPSVSFYFQGCQVMVLYGSAVRVIIERDQ